MKSYPVGIVEVAEVLGKDECQAAAFLVKKFFFEPAKGELNVVMAELVGEMKCRSKNQAERLAKRLERFEAIARYWNRREAQLRVGVFQRPDGSWTVLCDRKFPGEGKEWKSIGDENRALLE